MTTIRSACRIAGALITAAALSACGEWTSDDEVRPVPVGDTNARLAAYECNRDNNPFIGRNASGGNIFTGIIGMNECMRAHGLVRQSEPKPAQAAQPVAGWR